jgi:hypothetical protein
VRTDDEPTPPAALRARVLGLVAEQPALSRREVQRHTLAWSVLGVLAPLLLFALLGGAESGPRPWTLLAATVTGTAGLSVVALSVAFGRGGRTLGPAREWLVGVALVPALLMLLWKLSCSASVGGMLDAWPARPGLRCFGVSLLFGVVPLATFSIARRASDPVHPRSLGAALGASGGLWAATLVDLWCPVGSPLHVLLGHVLPPLLLAALGALAGSRLLSLSVPSDYSDERASTRS